MMTIQQQLILEISRQPDSLLQEVWHHLNFLKTKSDEKSEPDAPALRKGYGSMPDIIMAEDFDAPLPEFADYYP